MIKVNNKQKKPYLAVSVSYKSDLSNLLEFIEYHKIVGVQKIYFCNNEENPLITDRFLAPYVEEGYVENIHSANMWFGHNNRQAAAHDHVFNLAKRDSVRWLAMLDMDEFIFPLKVNTVPEVLMGYEDCSSLQINYACFGSSGHLTKQKLQTESYKWRAFDDFHWNHLTKSIAQVGKIIYCDHHHYFKVHGGWVDEEKKPCDWVHPPKMNILRINHYICRSKQDYEVKMKRGNPLGEKRDWSWFDQFDHNEVYDDSMNKFVPHLKESLSKNKNWIISNGNFKSL